MKTFCAASVNLTLRSTAMLAADVCMLLELSLADTMDNGDRVFKMLQEKHPWFKNNTPPTLPELRAYVIDALRDSLALLEAAE